MRTTGTVGVPRWEPGADNRATARWHAEHLAGLLAGTPGGAVEAAGEYLFAVLTGAELAGRVDALAAAVRVARGVHATGVTG